MTTLSGRLDFPNLSVCFLFEVTAGERLLFWTAAGGGLSNTYYAPTVAGPSRTVEAVKENGASLTERASAALVDANAGSWWWDRANARIYVHPTGSVSPYSKTLQGVLQFHFTDRVGRIYNGVYYDPRVKSLPSISMRIEEQFGGTGQIGGGKLEFNNEDGFFDRLSMLDWNAGSVSVKMGADDPLSTLLESTPQGVYTESAFDGAVTDTGLDGALAPVPGASIPYHPECSYIDFDSAGVWRVTSWERKDSGFALKLEERKGILKRKIPVAHWTREDWPLMDEVDVGKPKQIAYGYVYDVRPVCVDVTALRFRVAGHAVHDIATVRVYDANTETWIIKPLASKTAADAEFTLTAGDWTTGQEIAVDLIGKQNVDGTIMENPSDVVADLIFSQAGEDVAYQHAASFTDSAAVYHLGLDRFGKPRIHQAVALYVSTETEVLSLVERVCEAAGAYLFNDLDGAYRFVAFDPMRRADAMSFACTASDEDREIQLFTEITESLNVFSSVKVEYSPREQEGFTPSEIISRPQGQYHQGASSAVLDVLEDLSVSLKSDARYIAERFLRMEGEPHRTYKARVNWRGWKLLPGDFIHLSLSRGGVDAVLEILEVKRSLMNRAWVDLVLGDLHGLRDEPGWWAAAAEVFPTSLGAGSAAVWDDTWADGLKAFARQNVGYLADDNGLADPTDPDSLNSAVWT